AEFLRSGGDSGRSAPVLGSSNVRLLITSFHSSSCPIPLAFCARGRAHSVTSGSRLQFLGAPAFAAAQNAAALALLSGRRQKKIGRGRVELEHIVVARNH